MPTTASRDKRWKAPVAAAIGLIHAALLWLLLQPMPVPPAAAPGAVATFNVPLPRPPVATAPRPPDQPPRPRAVAAARPSVPAAAAAVVLQPAPATPDTAPPAAADSGTDDSGSGAGSGNGSGAGDGGGGTRARWLSGGIDNADYPRTTNAAGRGGTVIARFAVDADGHVHDCAVVGSSGDAALDQTTCRLIEQRFRYVPARDARGRAVADVAGWRQDWWLEPPR